ncbi:hypothetical protein MLP_17450 [Microlunatus phosphovorus NM-1]|uniref:Uncharacterized protein n=1 Tax=Microlunatus phosphovorus (strain ATCC 700054 / DSM 10555 / JCM 9379 / NBRC 101784 / NCIMB 13414 / VKM Ac-1990 / NM-1) TaxID=1032480 RepID=F5XS78_MICPN|nr:hypothetical protein MLP_17450 [Microlunatus phosphovorus NM-1]
MFGLAIAGSHGPSAYLLPARVPASPARHARHGVYCPLTPPTYASALAKGCAS